MNFMYLFPVSYEKKGEYRAGIFLTKERQKSRGGKVIVNREAALFVLYLYCWRGLAKGNQMNG